MYAGCVWRPMRGLARPLFNTYGSCPAHAAPDRGDKEYYRCEECGAEFYESFIMTNFKVEYAPQSDQVRSGQVRAFPCGWPAGRGAGGLGGWGAGGLRAELAPVP
jgi:hypothetical protein